MTPIYPNNSSPFPPSIDDYEVHHHQHLLFRSPSQASSSSSLTFPLFFNTTHDQGPCFDREDDQQEVVNKYMLHGGSSSSDHQFFPSPSLPIVETDHHHDHDHETNYGDLKLSLSNQEVVVLEDHKDQHEEHDHSPMEIGSSVKWMSSKMRLMRKMMNNPNRIVAETSTPNKSFDQDHHNHHQQISSSLFNTDNSTNHFSKYNNNNNNNNNNNSTIRVCADCNTTKTPLWRSGPRGPKSLCNACGIRQRKARRAMAAAAAAANNDTVQVGTDGKEAASSSLKTKGVNQKVIKIKKSSSTAENGGLITQYKKRCKIVAPPTDSSSSSNNNREKLCFEDFTISLMNKNNSAFHQVFPQDEKEAAILLMALSCGLVHG